MTHRIEYGAHYLVFDEEPIARDTRISVKYGSITELGDSVRVSPALEVFGISRGNMGYMTGWESQSFEYFLVKLGQMYDGTGVRITEAFRSQPDEVVERYKAWAQKLYDTVTGLWPRCNLCQLWCTNPEDEDEHVECDDCLEPLHIEDIVVSTVWRWSCTGAGELEPMREYSGHDGCVEETLEGIAVWCEEGDGYISIDTATYIENHGHICDSHFDGNYFTCAYCDWTGHQREMFSSDDGGLCEDCYNENSETDEGSYCSCGCGEYLGGSVIRSWDYRPSLSFHPPVPTNPKKPLYIGIEIEVSFDSYTFEENLGDWVDDDLHDLIYIKGDGSVDVGCEFVSHPMEPRWAMAHFPFTKFDELIRSYGALEQHDSCGTHIHMNKEAFTSAHLWKFLQVHYQLSQFLKTLGGRDDGTYSKFGHPSMDQQRKDLMKIVKEKDKRFDYERYVAVNLRNQHTVELRYMASGTSSFLIRKNMQLATALYEFSDFISVSDVREGALKDAGYLMDWINKGNYPELKKWMNRSVPTPKTAKGRAHSCV